MGQETTENFSRFRLGGIKLSEELALFTCRYDHAQQDLFSRLLDTIASQQINIHYLCHSSNSDTDVSTLCVATENSQEVKYLLRSFGQNRIQHIQQTGTLTLFPHRSSIRLMLNVLKLFKHNDLTVYGLCTSISALTLVMNYIDLDRSVAVLEDIVHLPENHAPLRQEFTIRQVCF
ncbi:hypothetical protein [Desulfopila sp. IMCC35008]|uniref:hypothetical protein n=1 Tax=Desulfopila sp. IMCC35008 TaxID=2653858 RepID=UPI0013D63727|nr:hypothetical protein [Desulfopila sp. IMCC35008]